MDAPLELPHFLQMEPVGQCNLQCEMCPVVFRQDGPSNGAPAFLSWETFQRTIDEFSNLQDLHLQGLGEPLMHPRFFDMVAYASVRGIRVTTNTNLTVLSPARAAKCVTSGLHTMHISIDAATPAVYEKIRRGSRFDRVMRNLGFLAEAKGAVNEPPFLRLVCVLMRQNLSELSGLVRLAHQWRIPAVFVQYLCHDFGEESLPANYRSMREFVEDQSLFGLDPAPIEEQFAAAREEARKLGIELRLPRPQQEGFPAGTPGSKRCSWPWTGMYVSYQGFVMPCCMIATPDRANFGNLTEASAAAVWQGNESRSFREQLDSDSPPAVCQSCSVYRGIF
jgi:radical SAM protein with 4Fe4S-binding SPASM domain